MRRIIGIPCLCLGVIGVFDDPGRALAQGPDQAYTRPLDPGREDVSPLGTSLILPQIDLRGVRTFDRVYRVPGQSDLLMRQTGALSAVFSQSDYVSTDDGVIPTIPAGTIFYIGGEPEGPSAALAPPGSGSVTPTVGEVATRQLTNELATWPESQRLARVRTSPAAQVEHDQGGSRRSRTGESEQLDTIGPRVFTISDEFYRQRRLRMIARRLALN